MKQYFCTLFDSHYFVKGVVMMRTLCEHYAPARIYVLCMDSECQQMLEKLALPKVTCIALADIESTELLQLKESRNRAEYCWTMSSYFLSWVMNHYPEIESLTYLDADLMFYSSVQPLFDEMGDASIGIIEHRFTPRLKSLEKYGHFCVEWVTIRRDQEGLACLIRWRDQCLEWCFDRLEEGRMGDQKYLDEWPKLYSKVHILQHLGAGLAPWNYPAYTFKTNDQGAILVNGSPLVFYHFHQFQLLDNGGFDRISTFYTQDGPVPADVYRAYEQGILVAVRDIRAIVPGFSRGMKSTTYIKSRRWIHRFVPQFLKAFLKRFVKY